MPPSSRSRVHLRLAGGCVLTALGIGSAGAADAAAIGDELALFDDLPVVVSGSRQETAANRSPVPVSVLDGDEIAASGHYQLDEVLRFVPGMDVRRIDRSRYATGVRGFHGSFSDRTLTLIDGRTADSPVFGGSEWYRLPLVLDDIERIEVVRGPGGAAWGANAFNGVINVITKDPDEMLGLHGNVLATHFGDLSAYARWSHAVDQVSWRIGAFYQEHVSSREALDDEAIPDNDHGRKVGTDNALVVRFNPDTALRAGIGYASLDSGVFELVGYLPPGEDRLDTTRAYARFDQQAGDEVGYRLGWYGNFLTSRRPSVFDERSRENVIEGQLDYSGIHQHRISLGAEWRMTDIHQMNSDPDQLEMVNAPYHEERYGVFLIDQWQATSRLVLEGQARADYYDGTGSDWAGRLAAMYGLDQLQHHVVRLATARAYRTPLPALRDSSVTRPTFGNPFVQTVVLPSDDLENEHTWTVEAGYAAELPDDWRVRLDTFYQRYEDLIGYDSTIILGIPTQVVVQPHNIDGATGAGGEIELGWSPAIPWSDGRVHLRGWYSLHHLDLDRTVQDIRAFAPSRHKAGGSLSLPLPERFALTVNYAYANGSGDDELTYTAHTGTHHQLDITLGWSLPDRLGTVMIGGWDVLNTRDERVEITGSYLTHETPGRTFFARLTLDF